MLRFKQALQQETGHIEAKHNLQQLTKHYPEDTFFKDSQQLRPNNHVDLEIKHSVKKMTRISIEDLFKPQNSDFANGKLPFILTGM
jgi:hypothetical protein